MVDTICVVNHTVCDLMALENLIVFRFGYPMVCESFVNAAVFTLCSLLGSRHRASGDEHNAD